MIQFLRDSIVCLFIYLFIHFWGCSRFSKILYYSPSHTFYWLFLWKLLCLSEVPIDISTNVCITETLHFARLFCKDTWKFHAQIQNHSQELCWKLCIPTLDCFRRLLVVLVAVNPIWINTRLTQNTETESAQLAMFGLGSFFFKNSYRFIGILSRTIEASWYSSGISPRSVHTSNGKEKQSKTR